MVGSLIALATALSWWNPAELQPKQKGVCVTEWAGGSRWEIPVEVEGVLDANGPDRTAVLVRLDDPRFKDAGVVAGMSGSPVYVDGKLVGAVAFGWTFARAPLAGVTPFTRMHEISATGAAMTGTPPTVAQLAGLAGASLRPESLLTTLAPPPGQGLSPVAASGLPTSDFATEVLRRAGLQPVPAGGDSAAAVPGAGDMVAVGLVWGDAVLAAAGTVTAREGDKLYAFGHPLFGLGAVRLPAMHARVIAVQTSYESSFKIFGVGKPFGTFVADRPAGMLADVGPPPAGIPVAIDVHDGDGTSEWRFHIAEVPVLEPLLTTYLVNACLTARGATTGEATVGLRMRVTLADGSSLTVDQSARGTDALARVATFAGGAVGFLANSAFPHPAISALTVELERHERALGADIAEVIPERTTVRPGETLSVAVRLLPQGQPARQQRLILHVPPDVAPGRLDLIVADGTAWSEYALKSEGLTPASFADEERQLTGLESATNLVAGLETREHGVALPGVSQPALPPSWAATLATGLGSRTIGRLSTAIVATSRWVAPYPLSGAFRISLTVKAPWSEEQ
jgi:SpoIVB peptidase S55